MAKRKTKTPERKTVPHAPMQKDEYGQVRNVGTVQGATLTVVPEDEPQGKERTTKVMAQSKPKTTSAVVPPKKKVVRLNIAAEFGPFQEEAETMEAAIARAEEIVAKGAWQKAGSQMVLHAPAAIRRVTLVQ
jgi:hypothetical protein